MNDYSKMLKVRSHNLERIKLPRPFSLFILKVKSKTRLNAYFVGLYFLNDLAKEG